MVRIESPSIEKLLEEEEEFRDIHRDHDVIGKPEQSVEIKLTGKYSTLMHSGIMLLEPLERPQIVLSFRPVSQEDYKELIKENLSAFKRIDSQCNGNSQSECQRFEKLYDELGIVPYKNVILDADLGELENDVYDAILFEKGLDSHADFIVDCAGMAASGTGVNVSDAYDDFRDDLSVEVSFTYELGDDYPSIDEVTGTAVFDSGETSFDIDADGAAEYEAEAEAQEVYREFVEDDGTVLDHLAASRNLD